MTKVLAVIGSREAGAWNGRLIPSWRQVSSTFFKKKLPLAVLLAVCDISFINRPKTKMLRGAGARDLRPSVFVFGVENSNVMVRLKPKWALNLDVGAAAEA